MKRFEYLTIEWLWASGNLKVNYGNGREENETGSYDQLVNLLNDKGREGWEAVSSSASANWVFWTLKKEI